MSKKTSYAYKVVVVPRWAPYKSMRLAIAEEVARAVEESVAGAVSASVEAEREDSCGHCGAEWVTGDSAHNGGCCIEDAAIGWAESNKTNRGKKWD